MGKEVVMKASLFAVSIRAKDVKKLAAFYKETFDFKVLMQNAGTALFDLGEGNKLVIQKLGEVGPEGKAALPADTLPGPSRYGMAFRVQDIDAFYKNMKTKLRISMAPVDEEIGRSLSGFDPEGNRIDFIQEKAVKLLA